MQSNCPSRVCSLILPTEGTMCVVVNSMELHRCKMLCLCKKKTRFNKHTPKLLWKMWKQTGSSFWSPQKDPPESSTSYTCFLFTAEAPARQKNHLIGFGLHYSFSLLNTSFSPLRSSEVTINTSSWMQCYAKNKLGLQGMMHLPQHVLRNISHSTHWASAFLSTRT